jgi:broad specificity phosphatase PhoE
MLRLKSWLLVSVSLLVPGFAHAATDNALVMLTEPGRVLLLRHARAPGIGDPPGMVLCDCATQRNLDERGRAQAVELGERLRTAGISDVQVYTSQWCRCRETAKLMAIGPVKELSALNSFFEQPETKEPRMKALREFLDALPRNGRPVVFVTHQVTISALTGSFPSSGEGLVLELQPGGEFKRVAEFEGLE